MKSLIAKLEAATGPSRELDALIECEHRKMEAYALGLNDQQRSHWNPIGTKGEVIDDQGLCRYHPQLYTASMDAGRSLIGPDCTFVVGDCDEDGNSWACVTRGSTDYAASAATPELALCIAALRSRDGGRG